MKLRVDLDRTNLRRGNHVDATQLWRRMAQYFHHPRFTNVEVLIDAIISGLGASSWREDSLAHTGVSDPDRKRDRHLRGGRLPSITCDTPTASVKPEVPRADVHVGRL